MLARGSHLRTSAKCKGRSPRSVARIGDVKQSSVRNAELKTSEVAADIVRNPLSGSVVTTSRPPPWKYEAVAFRLFASSAGVHVDFHANRHFDDLWSLPGHFQVPFRTERQTAAPASEYDRT
jgi:hypothetical protein